MKIVSKSLGDTKDVARLILEKLELGDAARVVALEGDLGSGKTALTQAAGELVGVGESMASPTFVIEKIYPIAWRGFKNFIHIDAYRLESEGELLALGWEGTKRSLENLIFIEWPERVVGIIPGDALRVTLKFVDESTREIQIHEPKI